MYHLIGAVPSSSRFGLPNGGTASITDYAESTVIDDNYFLIRYFPGATLAIEGYDERHINNQPEYSCIVEYADSSKNITVGRDGMAPITITDDIIGIRTNGDDKYGIRFEKYVNVP
jgi:hypothetical protein